MLSLVVLLATARDSCASVTAAELDRDVDDRRFPSLEKGLSDAKLTSTERTYFEGVLADRKNRPQDAVAALTRALPSLRKANHHRAAIALRALATDQFILGHYKDAVSAYTELLRDLSDELSEPARRVCKDNLDTFQLLENAPTQTITGKRTFTVPLKQDPIGDIEVPVQIGTATEWWILDTGANESTITTSGAKRLGLKVSEGEATNEGASGAEVPLKASVIPKLGFGPSVVHNVVALVVDDGALNLNLGENRTYQIQGILGYPVLRALGSFTVLDSTVDVAPGGETSPRSSPLFVEELTPFLRISMEGRDLLLILDTGAASTRFSAKYVREFSGQFAGAKETKSCISGAGGTKCGASYQLPKAELKIGNAPVTLQDVTAMREDLGTDQFDSVYGVAGGTLLNSFKTFAIDFRNMRFVAGEPLVK